MGREERQQQQKQRIPAHARSTVAPRLKLHRRPRLDQRRRQHRVVVELQLSDHCLDQIDPVPDMDMDTHMMTTTTRIPTTDRIFTRGSRAICLPAERSRVSPYRIPHGVMIRARWSMIS